MATGRTLTSAWIETLSQQNAMQSEQSRTLTSAWIETVLLFTPEHARKVALSRVRGLKRWRLRKYKIRSRRTLTSAWIETSWVTIPQTSGEVALSRVRGLKRRISAVLAAVSASHSHECVD